jgi:phosphate transport system permease protein
MTRRDDVYERRLVWRHRIGQAFEWLCRLATMGALAMLMVLMGSILFKAFSPGQGSGLAPVTLTKAGLNDSGQETSFRVSRVLGGKFEFEGNPDEKITSFSAADVREGKVVFNHDGKRKAPIFDLTVNSASAGKEPIAKIQGVGPDHLPTEVSVPDVHPPKPAKVWGWLTWGFLTKGNNSDPLEAGIMPGFWGSVWLICLTGLMAVPLGVGAAIYLEEYAKPTSMTKFIRLNIANLAGVPSIVYGILGFTVFSRMFGIFDKNETIVTLFSFLKYFKINPISIALPLGPVLLSGACTLALLSLPVVIITSQEALRSVPASLRHAAYALGATKWQTIWHQVLPAALPGILTGVILSLSRAIGEAAPIAVIGVAAHLSYAPGRITGIGDVVQHPDKLIRAPFDRFTALPTQVYSWVNEAAANFEHVAAAGILVLLATLLMMNGTAIYIRQRYQQKNSW